MVVRLPSKQKVEGSIPFSRSSSSRKALRTKYITLTEQGARKREPIMRPLERVIEKFLFKKFFRFISEKILKISLVKFYAVTMAVKRRGTEVAKRGRL